MSKAFCFLKGSTVECSDGTVQDCNMKRVMTCELDETNQKKGSAGQEKKDSRAFCFCVGELVDCLPGVVLDCNNKRTRKCPLLETEDKKNKEAAGEAAGRTKQDGRAFCFCKGEIVDCLPGVVLDCNNKRTVKCPLVKEEEDLAEQQTRAFEEAVRAHKAHKERKGDKALKAKEMKNEREFCFCVGELVDCPSATVQDCNLKKAKKCKLRE